MLEPGVLVIEDEEKIRKYLARALRDEGMTVDEAGDGEAGIAAFERAPRPVVLLDLRMPRLDGMAVLERIHATRPETQVIILSAHGDMPAAVRALNLHAAAWLTKPPDLDRVIAEVKNAWSRFVDERGLPIEAAPTEGQPPGIDEVWKAMSGVSLSRERGGG